jgi:hypothetical protein
MSSDLTSRAAVKPTPWLVGACLLAVYIVWGTTYFAIKVAIEGIAPFFLVGLRWWDFCFSWLETASCQSRSTG